MYNSTCFVNCIYTHLFIHARIAFKILLLVYHIHSGKLEPFSSYMSSMITPYSASTSRELRSSRRGDFPRPCEGSLLRTNLKIGFVVFSRCQYLEKGTVFQLHFVNAQHCI